MYIKIWILKKSYFIFNARVKNAYETSEKFEINSFFLDSSLVDSLTICIDEKNWKSRWYFILHFMYTCWSDCKAKQNNLRA